MQNLFASFFSILSTTSRSTQWLVVNIPQEGGPGEGSH